MWRKFLCGIGLHSWGRPYWVELQSADLGDVQEKEVKFSRYRIFAVACVHCGKERFPTWRVNNDDGKNISS